jgi:Tol biopolymer transport system component
VAVRVRDPQTLTRDIWVMDLARSVMSRLSFEPTNENYPLWSPDGGRILYYSEAAGAPGLYVRSSTGAGRSELLLPSGNEAIPTDWTRDGRFILYELGSTQNRQDVWLLELSAGSKPRPLLDGPFDEGQGRVSPDGKWIAYSSDETGRLEIYVQSFPEPGGKWQVSTAGGSDPVWRPDGRELFYLSADQRLMAMPVSAAPTFEVVVPTPLFQARVLAPSGPPRHYTVSADGQDFHIVAPLEGESVGTTTVVVNWLSEVKAK